MRGISRGLSITVVMAVVMTAIGLAIAGCANLVYKPAQLTDQGRAVLLVMSVHIGAECQWIADVEARNIHGDPKFMRNKLRNDTAKKGGNVVKVDNWAPRVYASGRGFKCPAEVVAKLATTVPRGDGDPLELAAGAQPAAADASMAPAAADASMAQGPVTEASADPAATQDAGVASPPPVVDIDDELPPPPPPPPPPGQ